MNTNIFKLTILPIYTYKFIYTRITLCKGININNYIIKFKPFVKYIRNIKIYNIGIKNIYNIYLTIKNILYDVIPFVKMLIIYLINKYYYKLDNLDFVIKAYTDRKTFNFFVKLNKIKSIFIKEKCINKLYISIIYYYLIMLIACIIYCPITLFLLRVLTDPQNWMLHYLEGMNLSMAL